MPQAEEKITKKEFEERVKDILDLNENNLKNIKVNGKPLEDIIKELNNKIEKLEQENTVLKKENTDLKDKKIDLDTLKEIFGKENFKKDENGKEKYTGSAGSSVSTGSSGTTEPNQPGKLPANPTAAQLEEQA